MIAFLNSEGIEKLQRPSRSSDMNPIEYMWDCLGCRVNKQNDVDALEDLGRALVKEWNNLEPQFLRKLVQGVRRRICELHQQRGGHAQY